VHHFQVRAVDTGKELLTRPGAKGARYELAGFAGDGKLLAWEGLGQERVGRLVEIETLRERLALPPQVKRITSAVLSPDGRTCVWGTNVEADRDLRLWDVAGGKEIARLKGHRGAVGAVEFAPDGKTVATAGSIIKVWDVATGKELHLLDGHTREIGALAFSSDGKTLASGGMDGSVCIWDTTTGKLRERLLGEPGWIYSVRFSPDDTFLVAGRTRTNEKRYTMDDVFVWQVAKRIEGDR
jgi:WD40 repeat protein